ncbi:unnamed protein product [Ectocarpus sp. CCAP 1310/34]|nr:unnamed protein product [Ectocarpus sp. CCAP 1310/34]
MIGVAEAMSLGSKMGMDAKAMKIMIVVFD